MNAGQAAELVAPFIDASYPTDRDKIFSILTLACNRAWKEGRFYGMTSELFVNSFKRNGRRFIHSPIGFGTLLAINVDCKPRTLRSKHFMFHKNGYGDIKDHCCSPCDWNEDVYDEGIQQSLVDFKVQFPNGAIFGARSVSDAGEGEKVWVNGIEDNDREAISFELENNIIESNCGCTKLTDQETVRTVQGVEIPLTKDLTYFENVVIKDLRKITKTKTKGIVEIYAFDPTTGEGALIMTLYPWDNESRTKLFRLPSVCKEVVHALFKVDRQPNIVSESQPIILDDEEAIISLAKGIYMIYYKDSLELGSAYITQGFNALEKQQREEESPETYPIQLIGMGAEDTPEILKAF